MQRRFRILFFTIIAVCLLTSCLPLADPKPLAPLPARANILAFGDSLTFGYGVAPGQSYPSVLQNLVGARHRVINAGINGDSTRDALRRLPAALQRYQPRLVILCIGGNDFLRRYPNDETQRNIEAMVTQIKATGSDVILVAVPSWGIIIDNHAMYRAIAKEYQLWMEDSALETMLNDSALKSDTIHGNEAGYRLIAESVYALLQRSGALAH